MNYLHYVYGLFCYSCICEQVKSVVRKKSSNVSLQRLQQHFYELQGDVEDLRTLQFDININNMIQMESLGDRLAGVNS